MNTTSHFIGIELKPEMFSDIFVEVYKYMKDQDIENAVSFQNPLSPHITLYYLEKDLSEEDKTSIKKDIFNFNISHSIYLTGLDYFYRDKNRSLLFFISSTDIVLKEYRDKLHSSYNRHEVIENSLEFFPHITFLRILDSEVFEPHRKNIEKIIFEELERLQSMNINKGKVSLYAVNSKYKEEIQIVI